MIQFLVRKLRDLPMHSIFICGAQAEQDSRRRNFYTPLLPGKLPGDIVGLVDTVGYLENIPQENGKVLRRCYLVGGLYGAQHIEGKHRYGSALKGLWIDNPTMQDFYTLGKK